MRTENYLEFERPIVTLEDRLTEFQNLEREAQSGLEDEIVQLRERVQTLLRETFRSLTPWQLTLLSRHPQRPHTGDYIPYLFDDFMELHGDRAFGDDRSIVAGLAKFEGRSVVVIGTQKGRTTREKVVRNFGMPRPEGYRKALRFFELAERFKLPVITLIDTPGAYPGVDAEERGQAEAIARNILVMAGLKTPIISVLIGEGGSGGALAIGVADRLLMLEYSIYSVISPEGCAAILWGDRNYAQQASRALQITSDRLLQHGIADEVIPEPLGGAHRALAETGKRIKDAVRRHLAELRELSIDELSKLRYEKYRKLGVWREQ